MIHFFSAIARMSLRCTKGADGVGAGWRDAYVRNSSWYSVQILRLSIISVTLGLRIQWSLKVFCSVAGVSVQCSVGGVSRPETLWATRRSAY